MKREVYLLILKHIANENYIDNATLIHTIEKSLNIKQKLSFPLLVLWVLPTPSSGMCSHCQDHAQDIRGQSMIQFSSLLSLDQVWRKLIDSILLQRVVDEQELFVPREKIIETRQFLHNIRDSYSSFYLHDTNHSSFNGNTTIFFHTLIIRTIF